MAALRPRGAVQHDWPIDILFVGVPVTDLAAAQPWYERLFGRPPDVVPNDTEVMWRATDGGWVYVIEDAARAGRAIVTIAVDDLDQVVAELVARAISPGTIEAVGEAGRKAITADADGNQIAWIQVAT